MFIRLLVYFACLRVPVKLKRLDTAVVVAVAIVDALSPCLACASFVLDVGRASFSVGRVSARLSRQLENLDTLLEGYSTTLIDPTRAPWSFVPVESVVQPIGLFHRPTLELRRSGDRWTRTMHNGAPGTTTSTSPDASTTIGMASSSELLAGSGAKSGARSDGTANAITPNACETPAAADEGASPQPTA